MAVSLLKSLGVIQRLLGMKRLSDRKIVSMILHVDEWLMDKRRGGRREIGAWC